ncbi:ankyrin repeat-containing domain protein [Trichoderma longibrachiatum]
MIVLQVQCTLSYENYGRSQDWAAWEKSAGPSFRLTRRVDGARERATTIDPCFIQLLLRFKMGLIMALVNTDSITPDYFSQHFDGLDKAYRVTDDDLFRICLSMFKKQLQNSRTFSTLMVLDNVDANVAWQASLVKELHETFQGSRLRLKVLITSPRIDVIRRSIGVAPQRSQESTGQDASTEEAYSATYLKHSEIAWRTSDVQPIDSAAWYIAERYHPQFQRLRSAIANFPPWLRSVLQRWLQDNTDLSSLRGVVDDLLSCPTEQFVIRAILNSISVKRPVAASAMTIILWCLRPLKKDEFEVLLSLATASSPTSERETFREVASLFHGLVIALRGRVSLANGMVREALPLHGDAMSVEWCRGETQSHSDLADWCLDYLRLPENQDILREANEKDRELGRDARHSLLWYAVDHWAEHARRSQCCWSPERQSFQSLLEDQGVLLDLWAVAWSKQQPALPSLAAGPRTALSILSQHGLLSAVEIILGMTRGQDAFSVELAGAFTAATSSGHFETIRVLAQEAEFGWFDVGQAVLASIETGGEQILVDVIGYAERLGLDFGDTRAYVARAASLDNVVALRVLQDKVLKHRPFEELSKCSISLSLACYTRKPDMLLELFGLGICPTAGDEEGWRRPMETICRYGGTALVEPFLAQFKSSHDQEHQKSIDFCQTSLQVTDEYAQYAATSSILNWASRNSLVLLDENIIQELTASFWSDAEHVRLLTSHLRQPESFGKGDMMFKKAVFAFLEKGVIEAAQELLRPPMTIDERDFCTLLSTANGEAKEKLVRLICSVGARSGIDMSHPAVRHVILTDGFIQKSIDDGSIASLLEYNLDPNIEIPNLERSMLGHAAYKGKVDAVRALLAAGAKVNVGGDDWSPLHCAYDSPEITALLLEHGADVDARDDSQLSALYFASKWGHDGVVSAILRMKPSRDTLEQALSSALSNSQTKIAELLTKHDADLTIESSDAVDWLEDAVWASDAVLVQLILDRCRHLDINFVSGDRWSWAVLHRMDWTIELSIIRVLVARGADVNIADWRNGTPLYYAARADNLGAARCLVRWGAEINGSVDQPLPLGPACEFASPEFVKFLIDEGADVNAVCYDNPGTALHAALLRDMSEDAMNKTHIINYLLAMDGIDVRIRSHSWGSVLSVAAMNSQPAIAARLLKMGVVANDLDHLGRQPIHHALLQSVEMAQLLLREEGVTLDGEDRLGRHALHFAVQSRRPEIVEFVLQKRPFLVNKPDIHGWTPLLWAIRPPPMFCEPRTDDQLKTVLALLLANGARKLVRGDGADGEVWTPVRLASYCNLKADVLDLVTPSADELRELHEDDGDLWTETCNRQGKLSDIYCDICLAHGIGVDYYCDEAECVVADFYICWKCALSKELLHPGSSHVLSAMGEEIGVTKNPASPSGESSEIMGDEESEVKSAEGEQDDNDDGSVYVGKRRGVSCCW